MTAALYPKGVFNWGNDRIDGVDVDWADDQNSLAAEVVALENSVGEMPMVGATIIGPDITYQSMSARLTADEEGLNIPVISLGQDELFVDNFQGAGSYYGQWNTYNDQVYDPYGMYNGVDVTIPVLGWWRVIIGQYWDWWSTGYHRMSFFVDEVFWRHDVWHWDFAGNYPGGWWMLDDIQRPTHTSIAWEGVLNAGQRIRVLSENGCPHTPHRAYGADFKASFVRKVPVGTPAG